VAEKKRRDSSILRRTRERKRSTRSEETAITSNAILPTADRDTIPADETIGIRKGPVRCEACNTDFASREDFEKHAIEDHPDIPARSAE
jgi:hypothetical protein